MAKAPKYQEVPGFDKSVNGLFKIHVYVDKLGFVWINLDSSPTPEAWGQEFAGVDEQPKLQGFNMEEYQFDHQWEMEGDYNWKTLADNYNEVRSRTLPTPECDQLTQRSVITVRPVIQFSML